MPLCEYGCGREATIQFQNGKWCCEHRASKCPYQKEHNRQITLEYKKNKEGIFTEESRRKNRLSNFGHTPWNKGKTNVYSEDTLKRMSEKAIGRPCCNKGVKRTPEQIEKTISKTRGKKRTPEQIERMKAGRKAPYKGNKGYKHTPEAIEKLRISGKKSIGRKWTAETRINFSKARKGKPGKKLTVETRRKIRLKNIERIQNSLKAGYQVTPFWNPSGCSIIDEYGQAHGYNFKHAMNGGEHFFKEIGYWVDGYDPEKNVVIEIDEAAHYDAEGNLKEKDLRRQKEIEDYYRCTFIRIRI
jgi:hypothetical protein